MDRKGALGILGVACGGDLPYAEGLEEATFAQKLRESDYRARVRHLAYNLRSNPLLKRHHAPREVAAMTSEQLRTAAATIEEGAAAAGPGNGEEQQGGSSQQPERGMLQCRKCKSWDTEWTTVQTRGADEAATIFARCNNCKRNWKPSNG